MSVLAHLAGGMGEPGATQALAYILNRQPGIVEAFVKLLGTAGITFDPKHRVESERGDDGGRAAGRPDMKIFDAKDNLRILVENKFWAGLTDAQPVDYLKMLPEDVSSGLLFIVPGRRVEMIWKELKTRCQDAGLDLRMGSSEEGRVKWMAVGTNSRMLVTDWKNVLDTLEGAADGQDVRGDILQIRQLAEALEDSKAFLPLRSDEVTSADLPRRIIDYVQLIVDICTELQGTGMTYVSNAAAFHGPYFTGRLRWNEEPQDDVYLTLSLPVWRESGGLTPLWLWTNQSIQLPGEVDDGKAYLTGNEKFLPIYLKLGVERERVIENAVEQIRAAVFGG